MKKKILLTSVLIVLSLFVFGVISVSAATTVNVSTVAELQSAHSYSNNMDTTWVYTHPTAADSLEITFSSDTATESNYDYIYIIDGNGNQIKKESGTTLAGKTITVPGNVVKIRLTSDGSQTKYGFRVTAINAIVATKSGTCGENLTWNLDNEGVLTIEGTGDMSNWIYDSTAPWYDFRSQIKEVQIVDGVTSIGNYAFYNCVSLTNVSIPESIRYIGVAAFGYCKTIESITLPNSVTSLEKYLFSDCDKLINVSIGNETTTIEEQAFVNCKSLTKITIPDSVTNIGNYAFDGCTSLENVNIPPKVSCISKGLFADCSNLKSIVIPDGITEIETIAFLRCTNLEEITIGEDVTVIGASAFEDCTGLIKINWNAKNVADFSSSNYVFSYAGQNGEGINVVFGDEVERIPAYCFYPYSSSSYAPKITSVTMGNAVTNIGNYAFYNCSKLKDVYYEDSLANSPNISVGSNNSPLNNATKHYTHIIDGECGETLGFYLDNDGTLTISGTGEITDNKWSSYVSYIKNVVLENGITNIVESAFLNCSGLTNITIPDSVTTIGNSAFSGCTALASITIPENVLTIGKSAFYNCKAVTQINWNAKKVSNFSMDNHTFEYVGKNGNGVNVIFGNNVESIPANVFNPYKYSGYAPKITNVTIGNRVTTIGSCAFVFCVDLKSIFIPKSVTEIGSSAFSACTNIEKVNIEDIGAWCTINFELGSNSNPLYYAEKLYLNNELITELIIPDGVETIGGYAFYNCTSLTSVIIPSSIKKIGWSAFSGCSGIISISLPKGLTEIGSYAFQDCIGLTNITFPDSVSSIGDSAFYGCTGLTSMSIPESVTSIGNSAFYKCSGLTGITIPDNVTTIGSYAFYRCTGLTDLTIGKNVSSIGNNAFEDCYHLTQINWNAKYVWDFSMDSEVFLDAGDSEDGIVVIFGDEVKSIPNWAFSSNDYYDYDATKIKKVIMGDNLKYVGSRAFDSCSSLEEVVFGSNLEQIEGAAFMNCRKLKSITLPESLTTIDSGAFRYCSSLEEINWNAKNIDTNSFGTFVFSDCGNSEIGISLTFGENVENIPDNLFYSEGSGYIKPQIKSVVIGNNMKAIPENLFWGMSLLTSITIPDTAIVIGNSAFKDCGYYNNSENWDNGYLYINNHLISADRTIASATVREGTITIAGGAFKENTELLKINLPATVEIISDYAFSNCNNLLKITIPENVLYIGKYAFSGCGNLSKINIPSTVTKIGDYAFRYCDSLEGVYITDINAWSKIKFSGEHSYWDGGSNPLYTAGKLYINDELAESISITENIAALSDYLFANCDNIKSVTLPESLTSIGAYAFYDCDNLTSINVPASVTTIGSYAFDDCYDLENVYITDLSAWCKLSFTNYEQNPLNRGASLYLNGELLEDLVIPEDVTVLNNYAFYNCDSLMSVVLHDNIEKIEESVFYDCDNLKYVVIPENILYIKNNSFYGCSYITHVFFKGSRALWDDMLIYSGNDMLNNATVVCNAQERTYSFETNCDDVFESVTAYYIENIPEPQNISKLFGGWYDNAEFSGEAITYPYYGDATTLYARWNDRSGSDFENAIYVEEGIATNVDIDTEGEIIYHMFIPSKTDTYHIYSTGESDSYVYLYDEKRNQLSYDDDGGEENNFHLAYEFTAGKTYYIGVKCYTGTGTFLMIVSSDEIYDDVEIPLSGACGDNVKWKLTADGTLTVTGTGTMYNFSYYYNNYWQPYKESIKNVIIEEGVTYIGSYAFDDCINLESVTIPKSVTEISSGAFDGCTNLKRVNLNDITAWCNIDFNWSSTANPLSNGAQLYLNGVLTTDITIPATVTTINNYAFYNCTFLEGIYFEGALPQMDWNTFSGCVNLTKLGVAKLEDWINGSNNTSAFQDNLLANGWDLYIGGQIERNIIIPATITQIYSNPFKNCKSIEQITFEGTLPQMYNNTFDGCTNLKRVSVAKLEDWLNSYNLRAFENNLFADGWQLYVDGKLLEDLVIPETVTWISNNSKAFYNCHSLKSVTFHEEFYTIPENTFANCVNLDVINLSSGINRIGRNAFHNTAFYNNQSNWSNGTLCIGNHLIKVKEFVSGEFSIPLKITRIAASAFEGTGVTKVYIHANVNNMEGAFADASNLTSAEITSGATYIPSRAFYNCSNLSEIIVPDSVYQIGQDAFNNTAYYNYEDNWENDSLYAGKVLVAHRGDGTGVYTVKAGIKSIASSAFREKNYSGIILPESLIYIGDQAFYNCTNLTEMTLPENMDSLQWGLFYGCTSLKTVTLSENIIGMSNQIFTDCTSLETIYNMPAKLNWYGTPIFTNCTSLKDIYCEGTSAQWQQQYGNKDLGIDMSNVTVHCAGDDRPADACGKDLTWSLSSDGIFTITGTGKMYDYEKNAAPWENDKGKIQKLVISDGVTKIGSNSFNNCPNLVDVVIPSSVERFGMDAFDCTSKIRRNVYITDLTKWFSTTFENAYANPMAWANVYLNNQLIEHLYVPENVTKVCDYAFFACYSLKEITMHKDITNDYNLWFYGCNNVTHINVAEDNPIYCDVDGVLMNKDKTILHQYNRGIPAKQYVVPDTVKIIGKQALNGCYNLESVVLPEGLVEIGYWSFTGSRKLKEITIPKTVGIICQGAFSDCTALTTVNYSGTDAEWEEITIEEQNEPLLSANRNNMLPMYTETTVMQKGKIFVVTPVNIAVGKIVILALYNGDIFVEMQEAIYEGEELIFVTNAAYTNAKVMVWDDLTNLKPVCDVEIVK